MLFAVSISESAAQTEQWGDSYRTYTINVNTKDSIDVELSYEIRFFEEKKVGKFETSSIDTFLMLLAQDLQKQPEDNSDILFYIHGMFGGQPANYNYTLLDFKQRYLEKENSTMCRAIGYRWPAQNPAYMKDKAMAYQIADTVSHNFNYIVNAISALDKKVNVIANSLGTELFKEMLKYELQRESNQIKLNHIILSAPDLPDTALEPGETMSEAVILCEGMTVYYSQKDFTLTVSKNLNKENRLGLNGPSEATQGIEKVCFVEVTDISDEKNLAWKMTGHSYVRASDIISRDMLSAMMGEQLDKIDKREMQDKEKHIYRLKP